MKIKIESNPLIIPLHRWIELGLVRGGTDE
jgi:hypothetical protein